MGRSPYQSEKRRKELARLKKQEEKRQRRFNKKHGEEGAETSPDGAAPAEGAGEDAVMPAAGDTAAPGTPEEKKDESPS